LNTAVFKYSCISSEKPHYTKIGLRCTQLFQDSQFMLIVM